MPGLRTPLIVQDDVNIRLRWFCGKEEQVSGLIVEKQLLGLGMRPSAVVPLAA